MVVQVTVVVVVVVVVVAAAAILVGVKSSMYFYLIMHFKKKGYIGNEDYIYMDLINSRSILHGVDPLSYFSFQPVLHDWCNKGRGMCYPVCGKVAAVGFLSHYLSGPLPYVRRHITINIMC